MKNKRPPVLSGVNQSQILSRIQVKTLVILIFHDILMDGRIHLIEAPN